MTGVGNNEVVTPEDVQRQGPGWIIAPAAVLTDERLTPVELRVFLALCMRANNLTHKCWPSYGRIARDARVARSSAVLAIKRLQQTGWLTIEQRQDSEGDSGTNLYTLNFENCAAAVPDSIGDPANRAGDTDSLNAGGSPIIGPPSSPDTGPPSSNVGLPSPTDRTTGSPTATGPERLSSTAAAPAARASDETPAEKVQRVRRLLDARAHGTYDALCARDTIIGGTAAILASVNDPLGGGRRYDWQTISIALIELGGSDLGGRCNAPLLRGMCQRIERGEPAGGGAVSMASNVRAAAEALLNFAEKHSLTSFGGRDLWDGRVVIASRDTAGLQGLRFAGVKVDAGSLRDLLVRVDIHRLGGRPRPVAIDQIARALQAAA